MEASRTAPGIAGQLLSACRKASTSVLDLSLLLERGGG